MSHLPDVLISRLVGILVMDGTHLPILNCGGYGRRGVLLVWTLDRLERSGASRRAGDGPAGAGGGPATAEV